MFPPPTLPATLPSVVCHLARRHLLNGGRHRLHRHHSRWGFRRDCRSHLWRSSRQSARDHCPGPINGEFAIGFKIMSCTAITASHRIPAPQPSSPSCALPSPLLAGLPIKPGTTARNVALSLVVIGFAITSTVADDRSRLDEDSTQDANPDLGSRFATTTAAAVAAASTTIANTAEAAILCPSRLSSGQQSSLVAHGPAESHSRLMGVLPGLSSRSNNLSDCTESRLLTC